jgi:PAS domain S-box-containing protein
MSLSPGESPDARVRVAQSPGADLGRLKLMARAMEQVGEGVAVYDNDDVLIYANPAFAAMHGKASSELEGQHYTTLTDAGDDAKAQRDRDEDAGVEVTRMEFTSPTPTVSM